MKTEALQKLGDLMTKETEETEEESNKKLVRCQNEKAKCTHYLGAHAKGGGECFAREKVEGGWKKACECTEFMGVVL
jgi:hypothetical protein